MCVFIFLININTDFVYKTNITNENLISFLIFVVVPSSVLLLLLWFGWLWLLLLLL